MLGLSIHAEQGSDYDWTAPNIKYVHASPVWPVQRFKVAYAQQNLTHWRRNSCVPVSANAGNR
jgi:hypothetical protein